MMRSPPEMCGTKWVKASLGMQVACWEERMPALEHKVNNGGAGETDMVASVRQSGSMLQKNKAL